MLLQLCVLAAEKRAILTLYMKSARSNFPTPWLGYFQQILLSFVVFSFVAISGSSFSRVGNTMCTSFQGMHQYYWRLHLLMISIILVKIENNTVEITNWDNTKFILFFYFFFVIIVLLLFGTFKKIIMVI